MSVKEENSISPETKEAVNALLEKLPPEDLEKAVGGLSEKQKIILKRAGITVGVLALLLIGGKLGKIGMFSPQEVADLMNIINQCHDGGETVEIDTVGDLKERLKGKNTSVARFKKVAEKVLGDDEIENYPAINNLIHPIV